MAISRSRYAFVFFAALGAVGGWLYATKVREQPKPPEEVLATGSKRPALPHDCSVRVTKNELETSIELGTKYMLAHQKAGGNFDYEYDWKQKTYTNDDSSPRQAGALWGLSLLHAYYGPKSPP